MLHQAFFAPFRIVYEGGIDPLIRGLIAKPMKVLFTVITISKSSGHQDLEFRNYESYEMLLFDTIQTAQIIKTVM